MGLRGPGPPVRGCFAVDKGIRHGRSRLLVGGRLRLTIPQQFLDREGLAAVPVGIQHGQQRRPLLHQPYPRMAAAVDAPLVTIRQPEPPFQLQVVLRQFPRFAPGEETDREGRHHRRHLLAHRVGADLQPPSQPPDAPLPTRAARKVQGRGDLAGLCHLTSDLLLLGGNRLWPAR